MILLFCRLVEKNKIPGSFLENAFFCLGYRHIFFQLVFCSSSIVIIDLNLLFYAFVLKSNTGVHARIFLAL